MTLWHWIGLSLLALALWKLLSGRKGQADLQQIADALGRGAALVDVRTEGEYRLGHLAQAKNVPLAQLTARLASIGKPDKPVVVYCASGTRSAQAASTLRQAGYREVYDLGAKSNGSRLPART